MNTDTTFYQQVEEFNPLNLRSKIRLLWLLLKQFVYQSDKSITLALGMFYLEHGYLRAAQDYFSMTTDRIDPFDETIKQAMFYRAIAAQTLGNHRTALGLLKLVTLTEPTHAVLISMAFSFNALEMYDQSEIAARAAYLLNPLDDAAPILLANSLVHQRKFTYARITLECLLKNDKPDKLPLYQNLFEVLCAEQKFGPALEVAEKMISLSKTVATKPDIDLSNAFLAMAFRLENKENIRKHIFQTKEFEAVAYFLDLLGDLKLESSRFKPTEKINILHLKNSLFPNFDINSAAT